MNYYIELGFKKGDTLVCKKSILEFADFRENLIYDVGDLHKIGSTNIFRMETFVDILYNKYEKFTFTTKKRSKIGYPYLWDYFYTPKETRDIKLNKLLA